MNLFNKNVWFFVLPDLNTFDAIIGLDFLNEINAQIDLQNNILRFDGGQENLKYLKCKEVNSYAHSPNTSIEEKLNLLLQKHKAAFADPNEALPYNSDVQATIRTTDQEPVYSRSYPYPLALSGFVNKEVADLLSNGIIRPSKSPYNNPIWVVNKKGLDENGQQKRRLVIDFRKLNSKTISDRYPIPNISTILSNLGSAKYFTTLDLKSGFHQVQLSEKDREKTAFSVNNGKYEFCRLPFGLKNAPSIFQRTIDDVLREHIGKNAYVYIDDIIIYSPTKEQHLKDIDEVLQKLHDANMRVSLEKSKFLKNSVEFLGFVVSEKGIKTCPNKIKDILNYKIPKTLRGLRSFLGLAGYYRRFVKDYARITKPLSRYLRGENGSINSKGSKNIPIDLDEAALKAFSKIKNILASEDVLLLQPDFDKPFELSTDASSTAIGDAKVLSRDVVRVRYQRDFRSTPSRRVSHKGTDEPRLLSETRVYRRRNGAHEPASSKSGSVR